MLEEVWNAWAAGFVDGEGSTMLAYSRPRTIRRRGREELKGGQVLLHVRVGQTVEAPLFKLQLMYGGNVKTLDMTMPSRQKNRLQFYEWNIFGEKAATALRKMQPYMLVKGAHADLAIEYFETCNGVVGNLDQRLDFYHRMRELQGKGVHLRKEISERSTS